MADTVARRMPFEEASMRPFRFALIAACFALAAGCDSTPTLSDLMPSATSIPSGTPLTLTAMLEDSGADLDGGKQIVTLTASGLQPIVRELPINTGGSTSRAAITLSIETTGVPRGPLTISLQVVDKSGLKSNVLS